jgi:phosphoserine phosphatase RsbX
MALNLSCARRAKEGESFCGDQCGWWWHGDDLVLAVADGLGHGKEAALAANRAMQCIGTHLGSTCESLFKLCDEQLLHTRGAALAVAIVNVTSGEMRIGSVGNIRAMLVNETQNLRLDGGRGIVGAGYKDFVTQTLSLSTGNTLAMFSDGVDEFPALREVLDDASIAAPVVAQVILDRWARTNDDALVLCYRHGG